MKTIKLFLKNIIQGSTILIANEFLKTGYIHSNEIIINKILNSDICDIKVEEGDYVIRIRKSGFLPLELIFRNIQKDKKIKIIQEGDSYYTKNKW